MTSEERRLEASRERREHWKRRGPCLGERAWGTVREDYREYGTAWEALPHDHARSHAYRWNEHLRTGGLGHISELAGVAQAWSLGELLRAGREADWHRRLCWDPFEKPHGKGPRGRI
jgi:hypothetical protein